MNYIIVVSVAAGVFIYLLYALPDSSMTSSQPRHPRSYDKTAPRAGPSIRLSRRDALAISLGLLLLFAILLSYERQLAALISLIVVATSIWAAIDSVRVDLRCYKTRIALHPILLFNAMYLLWPVLFPWYLVVRSKIDDGSLARK
jgi:hypothetical protein